ncbi:hypothetical protein DYD21_18735 [Rhodohalobacter sp. SW132]|uniref:hypothetical protein n=1 Tax=Rhodohalobacter sp. SW132 TaxID=2293433 RepID=UPI000E278BC3|nr:hypothetical protein [Rhodohalobacter sp. SW132]REL24247.1 hypothetical protein DYD21_18735 [Rhodohalobacter sp. SW132]
MWIYIIFLTILFVCGVIAGERPWFSLRTLTPARVLNFALVVLVVFTIMMTAFITGFFPQSAAAVMMAGLYILIAGFFAGYAFRMFRIRTDGGSILYQHRSFWVDHAPSLFAVGLIIYGVYRTSVLGSLPVTGIRFSSGLSLICFGIFGWTLKVVPEFRSKGVLFLDQFIPWKRILSWRWHSEDVLLVEYIVQDGESENRIKQFVTSIPPDEHKEVELVLKSKMEEYAEERSEELMGDD